MISTYYENSLLSMAAYADLSDGLTDSTQQKIAMAEEGMSDEQIGEFVEAWPDVRVYSSAVTGLRVNVFRNGADGWKHRNGKISSVLMTA